MSTADFGRRVELKRKALGWTQGDLAERLGNKHRVTISGWETGKAEPSIAEIQTLADVLETTVSYLINGVEDASDGPRIPKGYKLVKEEEWQHRNDQLITLQEKLIGLLSKE